MSISFIKKFRASSSRAQSVNAPIEYQRFDSDCSHAIKPTKRSGHAKPRLSQVPLDQPGRYYAGNVLAVAGFSAMTLNNRIKDGRFPKPRYDGKRRWWPTHEVKTALGL